LTLLTLKYPPRACPSKGGVTPMVQKEHRVVWGTVPFTWSKKRTEVRGKTGKKTLSGRVRKGCRGGRLGSRKRKGTPPDLLTGLGVSRGFPGQWVGHKRVHPPKTKIEPCFNPKGEGPQGNGGEVCSHKTRVYWGGGGGGPPAGGLKIHQENYSRRAVKGGVPSKGGLPQSQGGR